MAEGDLRFALTRLTSYDRDEVLGELRRVADLVADPTLTSRDFDRHSHVSHSTVVRMFGGWREALKAAGLEDRYSGRRVTAKMRSQSARFMAQQDMIAELRRVAASLGKSTITMEEFSKASPVLNAAAVKSRFGSWAAGLRAADLELSALGRRYTEDDYFENLLTVWTYHGRAPRYAEMSHSPSAIKAASYEARWGTWTKARLAFVERVNADIQPDSLAPPTKTVPAARPAMPRSISVGVRYEVLRRDHFRCVTCGASPANDRGCVLHVDHVVPVSRGGDTTLANLRSLCQDCNLGKSAKVEAR